MQTDDSNQTLYIEINDQKFLADGEPTHGHDDAGFRIETVSDIVRSVKKDSISDFLIDLGGFLMQYYHFMEIGLNPAIPTGFTWYNDGKYNIDTTIRVDTTGAPQDDIDKIMEVCQEKYRRV